MLKKKSHLVFVTFFRINQLDIVGKSIKIICSGSEISNFYDLKWPISNLSGLQIEHIVQKRRYAV